MSSKIKNEKNEFIAKPLMVKVKKNESIEKALSRFKRKVKDSKLMLEIEQRRFFEKKSDKKRRAKKLSKLRYK